MSLLPRKDYQNLLTYEQLKKYEAAIHRGYFDNYHGLDWRHTFYGAYIWKYPRRTGIITRFCELLGHLPEWEDITDDNLRDFVCELRTHLSPNSVRTICAELKALLNAHKVDKKIPSEGYSNIIKQKACISSAVYLTAEEIGVLHAYHPATKGERYVKRLFMVECLTGARKSDCERLSSDNISLDRYGRQILTYVSRKSKVQVVVPVDPRLPQYLVRERDEPGSISSQTFNANISSICRKCGIDERAKVFHAGQELAGKKYEFVTSHTGRRSFATNLARAGVALEQIALLMGHVSGNTPNIAMTQRYIVGKIALDASVFHYFGTPGKKIVTKDEILEEMSKPAVR